MVDLVVMRLANMTRIHPSQDNSHVCAVCGEPVGVYPSGQSMMRKFPMRLVCDVCASQDSRRDDIAVLVPGAIEEFAEAKEIPNPRSKKH